MGRDATKASGNAWYEARLKAAKYDESLYSREAVAERLGLGVDAVRRIENNVNKTMPVETAVLMADLYNAPELENYYCLNECPIGRRKPISCDVHGIDRVTVKLLKNLKTERLADVKSKLLDIAEDGIISEDELPDLKAILEYLDELAKVVSELKIIGRKVLKGDAENA